MIHYHVTPISGSMIDHVRFFKGRHALVQFFHQGELPLVAELCQSFIFDNGAFTARNSGRKLDVEGYIRWCEEWYRHPGFDWALIPDIIDGTEDDNDDLLFDWPDHIKGVPVWHLNESVDRLVRLANEYEIIALGSSGKWKTPNAKLWWDRIDETLPHILDEFGRPICKIHGLRMLNPEVFTKLPLSSADSTNAAINAGSKKRFGQYVPISSGLRAEVIAQRIEDQNSASTYGI